MKKNNTQIRRLRTGKPKNPGLKPRRKTTSSITTNYAMMLQLYCLNKKEEAMRKEMKYEKLVSGKKTFAASKPAYSIFAMIGSFFSENLLLLRKVRTGIAMVTE